MTKLAFTTGKCEANMSLMPISSWSFFQIYSMLSTKHSHLPVVNAKLLVVGKLLANGKLSAHGKL